MKHVKNNTEDCYPFAHIIMFFAEQLKLTGAKLPLIAWNKVSTITSLDPNSDIINMLGTNFVHWVVINRRLLLSVIH